MPRVSRRSEEGRPSWVLHTSPPGRDFGLGGLLACSGLRWGLLHSFCNVVTLPRSSYSSLPRSNHPENHPNGLLCRMSLSRVPGKLPIPGRRRPGGTSLSEDGAFPVLAGGVHDGGGVWACSPHPAPASPRQFCLTPMWREIVMYSLVDKNNLQKIGCSGPNGRNDGS